MEQRKENKLNLEEIEANKQEFISSFNSCTANRQGADSLLQFLINSDFFNAPASTRFHGSEDGYLCRHSLSVAKNLVIILDQFDPNKLIDRDSAKFCALVHDICKANFYKKDFKNVKDDNGKWTKQEVFIIRDDEVLPLGHGEKSVAIAQTFMKLREAELLAIRFHMGAWDIKPGDQSIGKAQKRSKLVVYLQCADMIAANNED